LRRDMNPVLRALLWFGTKPVSIRPWLNSSINAAYTPQELGKLAAGTRLINNTLSANAVDISLSGVK